jgi:serine/threonine protein kinase
LTIKLLKRGGEGSVFLAKDRAGKKVALKKLPLDNTEAEFVSEVLLKMNPDQLKNLPLCYGVK